MEAIFSVKQVTDWLLSKSNMSPEKLQEMLYYEYSWMLVALNKTPNLTLELFHGNFQAWSHGPVIPRIYRDFKKYKSNPIEESPKQPNLLKHATKKLGDTYDALFVLRSMKFIFNMYNDCTENQLELSTHAEAPWKDARKGYLPLDASHVLLNKHLIYNYYYNVAGLSK